MPPRIFLCLLSYAAGLCAQDLAARMDDVIRPQANARRFMGTVLVARGAEVLFEKAYGFANLEWDVPNAIDGKYRLGSVTKQFTAACILLLEERGKLKVEDPLKKYLPDTPPAWDKITLHHLLSHTSGIPNFTSFPDYNSTKRQPSSAASTLVRFRDRPLDFAPGEKWAYSNSGYILLGYLVEKISGRPCDRFVKENIFDPLGMKDTGYDVPSLVLRHRAAGYTPLAGGIVNSDYIDMTIPGGAGALYSTVHDLLRWEQGLFGGQVLSAASLARMTTPVKNDYGYGLGTRTVDGRKSISHGGGIDGFNTDLAYYPDEKLTIVVLANLNGPQAGEISKALARIVHAP